MRGPGWTRATETSTRLERRPSTARAARKNAAEPCVQSGADAQSVLQYLVERSVEGEAGQLKEYSVGVEVFDRGPSSRGEPRTSARLAAIDAALAKPATLPAREMPGKVLEGQLAAAHEAEYRFSDLRVATPSRTYGSPSGVLLNATYIDYLRRILPASSVRLRMTGDSQPIVIAADGKAVAVLMPVRR